MTTTTNLGLKKPASSDPIDISVLNENADKLDAFAGETNTALAGKQDSIADLAEIRSGAEAGATAVQQTAFETDQQRQDAVIDTKITMEGILGSGRQITDTAGQDDLILGKFFCANAADAGNISTSPWDSAYFGFTMRSVSTSQRFVQIAIQNDDSFNLAKRRYTGSWQPWAYIHI